MDKLIVNIILSGDDLHTFVELKNRIGIGRPNTEVFRRSMRVMLAALEQEKEKKNCPPHVECGRKGKQPMAGTIYASTEEKGFGTSAGVGVGVMPEKEKEKENGK